MTGTEFSLIFLSSFCIITLGLDLYRKFRLNKATKGSYKLTLIIALIYFVLFWDGEYHSFSRNALRVKDDIPIVESTMELRHRTRFKEHWINIDKNDITHSAKVIRLGMSIEKEIDFYNNSIESKTLITENIFPVFSDKIIRRNFLFDGIIMDDDFFFFLVDKKVIDKRQRDSIITRWGISN